MGGDCIHDSQLQLSHRKAYIVTQQYRDQIQDYINMKLYQILTLTSGVGAVWPAFLGSSACNIESKANVPGVLAVAAKASREFATETLPHAIDQSTKWVVANPFSCGGVVVGLLSMTAPGLVATPLLGAMGFGAEGIIASEFISSLC